MCVVNFSLFSTYFPNLHQNFYEKMTSKQLNTVYGLCRCCLSKGFHRDMMTEYYSNGIREVYCDILIECFNLQPSSNSKLSTLICKSCTERLRDASNFKIMVVNTEQQLIQMLNSTDDKETLFINVPKCDSKIEVPMEITLDMKKEADCHQTEWFDPEWVDDAESCDYIHEDNIEDIEGDKIKGEAELLSRFPPGSLKPLPTKETLGDSCEQYWRHLEWLKGKVITAKMLKRFLAETPDKKYNKEEKQNLNEQIDDDNDSSTENISYMTEKKAHVNNIATLLEFSNLTAFKTKYKNGFPCFYCNNRFENLDILREHQKIHPKNNLSKIVLGKYRYGRPDNVVVNADIKDLKCTICNTDISSIANLKIHLNNVHDKKIDFSVTDRVIPFKMAGDFFKCQICSFDFETFGTVERHMSTHFRNYVCTICDAGFINKNRLKVHLYSVHPRNQTFHCNICDKVYETHRKFKIHNDVVHNSVFRNQCPKCNVRFSDYSKKQKHLVDVHGVTPTLYSCRVCDKSFSRPFTLTNHIKKHHLEEREVSCQKCSYKCFSNKELKAHLVKQHGEKLFECAPCKKSYACQKSFGRHLRKHKTDTQAVCGNDFIPRSRTPVLR